MIGGVSKPKIIISYRRRDSEAMTGRIFDRLVARFGRDAVFRDIDNIRPGMDFRAHIADALAGSDILLAIVGPNWVGRSSRAGGARINDENDLVRIEVETALQRGIPVIPVLLADTKMPSVDRVPDRMKDFVFRHAFRIDPGRDFEHHMNGLTSEIDQILQRRLEIAHGEPGIGGPPPPSPDKPSIAVLPFTNMSGDPEQDYFADGMVEEIITALSRIPWLFVIARNSSFTYKGQVVDVKQVGRELVVRYVLEGSVRKAGGRVRITAQLIEATSGAHLWADRFDGSLEDVFDLQDKVASNVSGVIEPALQAAETTRSADRPTKDLTAYDLYLHAYGMLWSSRARDPEALLLMEQAIGRDPHYGPALTWAAICCLRLVQDDRSNDPKADHVKGVGFARRALELSGDDPEILANAAFALAYFGEDIGAMMALVDQALALNPNYARGWHVSGMLRLWAGQPDIAIDHINAALRLSPRIRVGNSLLEIGAAHFFRRRFDEAVPKLLVSNQQDPTTPPTYRYLAACYAHMGRLNEARQVVERLRTLTPQIVPSIAYLRSAEHRELFLSGLRLAMGEAA
jgi:adenylate cyclase